MGEASGTGKASISGCVYAGAGAFGRRYLGPCVGSESPVNPKGPGQ